VSERLLILGASGRAAAASARRAGFEPFAIDLFADADTKRICDSLKCPPEEYPHGLFRIARLAPPMPWIYTGGLENYPELVGELAAERELWGNGPDVLRQVRDPYVLDRVPTHVARFAEVLSPTVEWRFGWPERDCVRKPRRGSGGSGIRFGRREDAAHPDFYHQEFVEGEPRSAICVAASSQFVTLGVSLQLVGTPWLHARRFQYAGSVVRPRIDNPVFSWAWDLCEATGLRGLFGLDFVAPANHDRGYHVVDVNPRYVASIEVHEFATGTSLFRRETAPPPAVRVVGKAIYYAPRVVTIPASGPWDASLAHAADVWRRPDFADIPHAGDVIDRGHPVLPILDEADTEAECLRRLQSRAADLDRLFGVRP
jgi:predicted ATP-grasp superfamily ATP-dependent carboligase